MELVAESDAGIVVDVGDMDAMAAAIVHLASNPRLQTDMGQAARQKVELLYSIDAVASGHEKLYWRLVP
jgi:glycosyltransferase involved in cell wall biosynthesis